MIACKLILILFFSCCLSGMELGRWDGLCLAAVWKFYTSEKLKSERRKEKEMIECLDKWSGFFYSIYACCLHNFIHALV